MRYFANPSTPAVRAAMASGRLGCIQTPGQGNAPVEGAVWAADNGCFSVSRGKSAMYRVDPLAEDARPSGDAPVTQVQKARLGVVMKRLLIDGPGALLYASDVLERDVASANDLTAAEADRLLAVMESEADAADTARATQDAADIGA